MSENEVRILFISELKAHELPDKRRVKELEEDMRRRGILLKPIIVDRKTKIIIDGHCRCDALRRVGCRKVAVRFVDYLSEKIAVEGWNGEKVNKKDVLEAGMSGVLMKPKTTRHIVRVGEKFLHISEIYGEAPVSLSKLI
ncbi:MAG: ParB N-terminal domain-containing protein [Candidatus Micrarchaeia archaeon]